MLEKTQREVLHTLFSPADKEGMAADPRTEVLVAIVFDLLMEVEALRSALLASDAGAGGLAAVYGQTYRDAAYLTHNACGPSSGLEKLLALFYPKATEAEGGAWRQPRTWRECLMLRRLGFSEEEVRAYKEAAEQAETFT